MESIAKSKTTPSSPAFSIPKENIIENLPTEVKKGSKNKSPSKKRKIFEVSSLSAPHSNYPNKRLHGYPEEEEGTSHRENRENSHDVRVSDDDTSDVSYVSDVNNDGSNKNSSDESEYSDAEDASSVDNADFNDSTAMDTMNLDDYQQTIHPLPRKFLEDFYMNSNTNDVVFGPYIKSNEQLYLGNKTLSFNSKGDIIVGDDNVFPGTEGLYTLIFKDRPQKKDYTYNDRVNYLEILKYTGAYLQNNGKKIKSSKSFKYKEVVSALAKKNQNKKEGKGFMRFRNIKTDTVKYNPCPKEYVWFDEPDEIVNRLRLLISEQQAGNTSVSNEIASIIEELTELNIIINKRSNCKNLSF